MTYAEMIGHFLVVVLLATATIGAPVQKTDVKYIKLEEPAKIQTGDKTANELEQLSNIDQVVLPAASIITESQPESQATPKHEPETPVVSDQVLPTKRGFPMLNTFSKQQRFPSRDVSLSPRTPDVDLSPRAVAEYLLVTTDFDGFEQAMADLMNIGVLSPSEVMQYKDSVSFEYESMLRLMAQAESQYLQELSRVSPVDYYNSLQQPSPSYPEYPFNQNSLEYNEIEPDQDQLAMAYQEQGYPRQMGDYRDQQQQDNIEQILMDKQKSLDDVLSMVLQQYYNQQGDATDNDVEYRDEQLMQQPINDEVPEELPSYDNEPEDDDTMKQLIAYLQQTLVSETAGAGIMDIPDTFDEQKGTNTEYTDTDVAKELDDLPESSLENMIESDESSGDVVEHDTSIAASSS